MLHDDRGHCTTHHVQSTSTLHDHHVVFISLRSFCCQLSVLVNSRVPTFRGFHFLLVFSVSLMLEAFQHQRNGRNQ